MKTEEVERVVPSAECGAKVRRVRNERMSRAKWQIRGKARKTREGRNSKL